LQATRLRLEDNRGYFDPILNEKNLDN